MRGSQLTGSIDPCPCDTLAHRFCPRTENWHDVGASEAKMGTCSSCDSIPQAIISPCSSGMVCGTDRNTYGSSCLAICQGIEISEMGSCDNIEGRHLLVAVTTQAAQCPMLLECMLQVNFWKQFQSCRTLCAEGYRHADGFV